MISNIIAFVIFSLILRLTYGGLWRLYWSPIAHIPGPKLAALTRLYELYYEIYQGGQYTFKIGELHNKYGPIVRISPWELHINDPDYYDELYAGPGNKRNKYIYYTEQFGTPLAMINTIPHNLHRIRRAALSPFFSKASVTRLEPLIQEKVEILCSRLRKFKESGQPVSISLAYACLTNDVVSEYCFAKSYNYLERSPDFHTDIHDALEEASRAAHVLKQIPWALGFALKIPPEIMHAFTPKLSAFTTFRQDMVNQIQSIVTGESNDAKSSTHPIIFNEIINSDHLPPQEKTTERMWQEGQTVIGAGTETTAWTLSVITYHMLANRDILKRLQDELKLLSEDHRKDFSLRYLEQLPYLSAVISEGLRLSFGVTTRLQRVNPDEVMEFKEYDIPPGTPVGMTSVLIHLNPSIFPSPTEFRPTRWLNNPRLSKYLVSFCRGTRQCLGMNLAFAEIYMTLANLIIQFPEMEVFDTTAKDVEIVADYYMPRSSGRGVKIMLS